MRVLVAHASETSRSSLVDIVNRGRRLSLDILTAADGPGALELLLGDDPPEVALIDWDLPGIEAPEMCRLVRDFQRRHHVWMIVLTPPAHREAAADVWKAGADDCVFTPASPRLLSERVTKGLCEIVLPLREAAVGADGGRSQSEARSALEAICRSEDETREDGPAGVAVDLRAVISGEDRGDPAALAAAPVELAARRRDPDESDDAQPGHVTLEAVVSLG